ncbi:hypothetical protein EHS25_003876 [Saitozyma podzolica]|uniref:FAD dependent oxidoreductase domain-containing protein n=1 Tax=Saitozyma podzolica TaxID=1890683 RepID=A0A427Y3S8_9TREE|nr:hypothetical protein EHS25_003876 [Saitozyma podzolica]
MYDAVVLGAGVIGLSIALELHSRGLKVAVVARDLPDDSDSVGFASPWAGCNWFPFDESPTSPASIREKRTFSRLAALSKAHPELCERIPFFQVWDGERGDLEAWYKDTVGEYRLLDASRDRIPGSKRYGRTFTSYILHAPRYTAHLGSLLRQARVPLIRRRLSSLDEAYNLPEIGNVRLVINATGLGARSLIGVMDPDVYPARGQTVLVRAPEVRRCIMHTEGFMAVPKPGEAGPPEPAYIIPRPGPSGHVVLGGTYLKDNHSVLPDLSTAQRILRDCYNLEPLLAGKDGRGWEDIEVVAHNVGLRPAREGGARIELELRELGNGVGKGVGVGAAAGAGVGAESTTKSRSKTNKQRQVAVVHAYGFGSAGFQQSLGAAEQVAQIVEGHLKRNGGARARL